MILLRFDLRIPPFVKNLNHARQYAEMLEMCRYADVNGFAGVVVVSAVSISARQMTPPPSWPDGIVRRAVSALTTL